jgi:hypothetical protein
MTAATADRWWLRGWCRGKPAAWWEVTTGLTRENRAALRLCRGCPVRRPCRDDMLAAQRPAGIIAGAWLWDRHSRPTPCRGDEHLLARWAAS